MKPDRRTVPQLGFTLIEIMIVVLIIGTLAAMAIPNIMESVQKSRRTVCLANLRQIESGKLQWATENRLSLESIPKEEDLCGKGRPLREAPQCPSGGVYTFHAVEEKPTCSVAGHTY